MSTPTDPYSSSSRRPFEDDEILAPLPLEPSAPSAAEAARNSNGFPAPRTEPAPSTEAFATTQGMDPAFDQRTQQTESPSSADAPQTSSASLAEAIGIPDSSPDSASPSGTTPPRTPAGATSAQSVASAQSTSPTQGRVSDYSDIDYSYGADASATASPERVKTNVQEQDADAYLDSLPERSSRSSRSSRTATEPLPTGEESSTETTPRVAAWGGETAIEQIPEAPKGRGWAHTGVLIATLVLVPIAWYLLSDASARLFLVAGNPWETGNLNLAALGELAGGIAVVALIWLLARVSSLGALIIGALTAILGLLALVLPTFTQDSIIARLDRAIGDFNDLTSNVIHHVTLDLGSGRMLMFGAILLLTGMVSHSARRRGERYGAIVTRRSILLSSTESK
ncbi:hypothetical protein VR010_11385 [Actinomycetaceae bacterium L2_0104]